LKIELLFMYFCSVKYKPKMVMSTMLLYLFVPAKLISYAFGLYFCVFVWFTPLLKHLILLAKQAFVCNTLIITPPPPIYNKQCSVGMGGNGFYRGCSLKMNVKLTRKVAYLSVSHLKTNVLA
jgi:hypothetical protein